MPDLLLESFARNGRVNAALLSALTDADLDLSDGRGGWPVRQHLAHLANFRRDWLSNISPAHAEGLPNVYEQTESGYTVKARDPVSLTAALQQGDEAAVKAVQDAVNEGLQFADPWNEGAYQSHPSHFLQHTIVHDSHHRGQIMALLRMNGRSQEQMDALEEATWPIWRE
ncbi:DinB family protein [Deinococcus sp.]|uniref:DinB family protein n=1 Tax=Deinococcus sp. TaxID=47478 RepID=UPI003CC6404C